MIKFKLNKKLDNVKIKRTNERRLNKNMIKLNALQPFWFITINQADNSIIHHGMVDSGQEIVTGQPSIEEYDNEADYLARLAELGVENITDEGMV